MSTGALVVDQRVLRGIQLLLSQPSPVRAPAHGLDPLAHHHASWPETTLPGEKATPGVGTLVAGEGPDTVSSEHAVLLPKYAQSVLVVDLASNHR